MKITLTLLAVVLFSTIMSGCSSYQAKTGVDRIGYTETGKASFYANRHQLKKTASGELYDHKLSTGAHRTLPFGAKVKVTNIENGKTVVVKINDRGPFVKGRIIDLSRSAFESIANRASGVIEVRVEVVN
jgi:rare lipoprotein A